MWKKLLALAIIAGVFTSQVALASNFGSAGSSGSTTLVATALQPALGTVTVNKETFNPQGGDSMTINFNLSRSVKVNAYITAPSNPATVYAIFSDGQTLASGNKSYTWYGTVNNQPNGTPLANGQYEINVFTYNTDGSGAGYNESLVYIQNSTTNNDDDNGNNDDDDDDNDTQPPVYNDGVIEDFYLNPSNTWEPIEEYLEIEFELTDDVDSLTVEARKIGSNKKFKLIDDDRAYEGTYEELWDGTDDNGDYIQSGTWEIVVMADDNTVRKSLEVIYQEPSLTSTFVTKDEFDPAEGEFTSLVFKADMASVVTVEVYNGTRREVILVDEMTVRKNRWYAVTWDGTDRDGDEVNYGGDYRFKIIVQNEGTDEIYTTEYVDVKVREDEVSSNRTNIIGDHVTPVIVEKEGKITFKYNLDDQADVYLAVYDGFSTSGSASAVLLDYLPHNSGDHTIEWNGKDSKGKQLGKDTYTYKLIARSSSNSKETEIGRFVIGDGDISGPETPDAQYPCRAFYYFDSNVINADSELCQAITWATDAGIFRGYSDGQFKPFNAINRAEVLKTVLIGYNAQIFPANGTNLGYSDADPSAWYMSYLRSAIFYRMFNGYPDGTARLANTVNRAELLKLVLEASRSFKGTNLESVSAFNQIYGDVAPGTWYYVYANNAYNYDLYTDYFLNPADLVSRGEMAILLFRMHKKGLL